MRSAQSVNLLEAGQVSKLTGVTTRQLRYWAALRPALILPSHTTPGGLSRYSEGDVRRIRAVQALLKAGLSLQRIRQLDLAPIEDLEEAAD